MLRTAACFSLKASWALALRESRICGSRSSLISFASLSLSYDLLLMMRSSMMRISLMGSCPINILLMEFAKLSNDLL
jgi:hypothetical protein